MNISPILLLAVGSTFSFLYGLIITIGWAITRRNRKTFHNAIGYSEIELFDLNSFKSLEVKVKAISLENNFFVSKKENRIDLKKYNCYVVDVISPKYPKIQKGDLILVEPISNKIKYAFKIPDLMHFR